MHHVAQYSFPVLLHFGTSIHRPPFIVRIWRKKLENYDGRLSEELRKGAIRHETLPPTLFDMPYLNANRSTKRSEKLLVVFSFYIFSGIRSQAAWVYTLPALRQLASASQALSVSRQVIEAIWGYHRRLGAFLGAACCGYTPNSFLRP